jgi:hypothetical protein
MNVDGMYDSCVFCPAFWTCSKVNTEMRRLMVKYPTPGPDVNIQKRAEAMRSLFQNCTEREREREREREYLVPVPEPEPLKISDHSG